MLLWFGCFTMSRSLHNLVFFVVSFVLFHLYLKPSYAFLFVLLFLFLFLLLLKTADCIQVYCFLPPRFLGFFFQWQYFDGDRLFTNEFLKLLKEERQR